MSCKECPEDQWTADEGATNSTECKDKCLPGTFSSTGVAPCYRCDFGFYESKPLSTNCTICPNETTTLQRGSNSSGQCKAVCEPGYYSESGVAPCVRCPMGSYQPSQQMAFCIVCPGNTTTLAEGATLSEQCQDIDECNSQPCQNNATCLDRLERYSCLCVPGFTGENCEVNIDECGSNPCLNGATCKDSIDTYACQCAPGYEGTGCDLDIDECLLTPCQNNGTCVNYAGSYECRCPDGFHGQNCEYEINACSPNPCQNGATCEIFPGDVFGYKCICPPGYSNLNCSRDINECNSDPCLNGGSCTDEVDRYTCDCPNGYEGERCEIDIDLCADVACENNATCIDFGIYWTCFCTSPYAGTFCEKNKTICDDGPCQHGGNCTSLGENEFSCECRAGFVGQNCEVVIDACLCGPCSNDASCSTDPNGHPLCLCTPGYTGSFCEDDIDECMAEPCGANGTCIDKIASYECHCADAWEGPNCAVKTNFCEENPCDNGGTCNNVEDGYVCICPAGYRGFECEVEVKLCSSEPCYNGGTCQESFNVLHCQCPPGFTGDYCEVNIDECDSMPCFNNGTCNDEVSFYCCMCLTGYTGSQCEQIIYPCIDSPCDNGGTCSHLAPGSHRCYCPEGFTGDNCETDINECNSFPCFNYEECVDGRNGYSCVCKAGFSGTHCEVDIDECASSPCQNNAICVNLPGDFSCECLPGYEGVFCETDIYECMQQPCKNGATCLDEVNAFRCICASGFIGTTCQVVEAPQCYPTNHCMNGATCLGRGDSAEYTCDCLAGFTGTLCEENIDECLGNQCLNGATCIDKVNGYVCRCPPGHEGIFCDENSDDCTPNQCENNGVCIDLIDGFICDCSEGFDGTLCQVNLNECESTPCEHGGTCTDHEGLFTCECLLGYSGDMCETNIDDCAGDPCHNGAYCLDGLNSFTCTCAPGFTGELCEHVLPSNYDFIFVQSRPLLVRDDIFSSVQPQLLTLSLWLRTSSSPASFSLLHLERASAILLMAIKNPCSLRVEMDSLLIDTHSNLCDNVWHHIVFTWDLEATGNWELRVNASLLESGSHLASITPKDILSVGASQMEAQEVVFLSSYNLWSTEVSDDIKSELAINCISGYFGDLISWTEFVVEVTESNELLLTSPSVCDSFDECVSNPCKYEGTCINLPNEFTCACRDGFTGPTCEGFVDICKENYCQHGGTCSTIEGQLVCACEVGFSGDHCEFEIIDGGWSGWSPWTECPVTCGGGVHSRYKLCDNPEPQNGGQPCKGEGEQEEPCNTQECPGCIDLRRPLNGYLHCDETPTLITCTTTCRTGYEPENSKYERDEYFCGEDTNYRWNHQTPANPYARLPSCVEVQKAMEANGFSSVDYPEAFCQSSAEKKAIEDGFRNQLLGHEKEFECLSLGTCQIESVEAVNCESVAVSRRAKRVADTGVTVMVTTLQNLTHGDEPGSQPLDFFLETFDRLVQQDSLVLTVDNLVLEPNKSSVYLGANQKCPPGSLAAIQFGYCVPCGPGTYYSFLPNDIEYECNPCPLNTYQEDFGQTECIPCPTGNVTAEPFSSNISDCFVPEAIPPVTSEPGLEKRTKIIISVTSIIAGLLVIAGAIVWYFMWYRPRAKVSGIATGNANSQAHNSHALQLRGEASENPSPYSIQGIDETPALGDDQPLKDSTRVDAQSSPACTPYIPRPKLAFNIHKPLEQYNPDTDLSDPGVSADILACSSMAAPLHSPLPPPPSRPSSLPPSSTPPPISPLTSSPPPPSSNERDASEGLAGGVTGTDAFQTTDEDDGHLPPLFLDPSVLHEEDV